MLYYIDIEKKENESSSNKKYFDIKEIIKKQNIKEKNENENDVFFESKSIKLENVSLVTLSNNYLRVTNKIKEGTEKNELCKNIFIKIKLKIENNKNINELKKINKELKKSINIENKYILSKTIKLNKMLNFNITKVLKELNCMEKNGYNDMVKYTYEYIKEYVNKKEKEEHNLKIAIIYNGINNVDKRLYEELVSKVKRIDIINMKGSNIRLQKFVDKINQEYGSSNVVIKKKNLREYDICINIDLESKILFEFKYGKDTMIIDLYNEKTFVNNIKVKDILNVYEYISCENNYLKDKELSNNAEILKLLNNYHFINNFTRTQLYAAIIEKIEV